MYDQRLVELAAERDRTAAASRRLAAARGLVFVAGLAALLRAGWPGADGGILAGVAGAAAVLVFIGLVHRHETVERRLALIGLRIAFNREGAARLERRWDQLPDHSPRPDPGHPYAADLGVTGPTSLLHLIGGWCTPLGRDTLLSWLLTPAAPEEIRERQHAAAALAPLHQLRESLGAHARPLADATAERLSLFTSWASSPTWFTSAAWRPWLARAVTAMIWGGVALHAAGAVAWAIWIPPVVAGWIVTATWRRRTHETFAAADPGRRLLAGFPALLGTALRSPTDGRLAAVRARLAAGPRQAPASIERLEGILAAADARHMWLHFILQSFTLWDFHVLAALERWQHDSGAHAPGWLAALGEIEALAALALLRYEHPDWCVPDVDPAAPAQVSAAALVHPLLEPAHAVANDVTVGPPGTVLVITGSNMSGKSTLLRGLGLNAVLAQAGGPVAAAAFRMPPMAVATCMRVEDSLAGGVSYFMAELLRLRRVTEEMERAAGRNEAALYLLDEILQGTNTAERRVAAVHVLERLIGAGAVGAVTTHDLDLADAPELRDAAREVHFQETVDEADEAMSFDYRLKPGRATSVNALRLMRMAGL